MRTIATVLVVVAVVAAGSVAFASVNDPLYAPHISHFTPSTRVGLASWDQSNLHTLRSFDKAAIFKFVTQGQPAPDFSMKNISQYGWFDLADNGREDLAMVTVKRLNAFISIYSKDAEGKVTEQVFRGPGKLSTTIRDLNGDGRDELILYRLVVENDRNFYWPAVYRLQKGIYVEASRDFPDFYYHEVLPKLDKKIKKARAEEALTSGPGSPQEEDLAGLIMERDKILRMLGRDPTAGLQHAYRWLNSEDPALLQDAEVTFGEIPGHKAEMLEARKRKNYFWCQQNPDMSFCRKMAQRKHAASGE